MKHTENQTRFDIFTGLLQNDHSHTGMVVRMKHGNRGFAKRQETSRSKGSITPFAGLAVNDKRAARFIFPSRPKNDHFTAKPRFQAVSGIDVSFPLAI